MSSSEQAKQIPTVELHIGDGTVATWFLDTEADVDRVDSALTELLGPAGSLLC